MERFFLVKYSKNSNLYFVCYKLERTSKLPANVKWRLERPHYETYISSDYPLDRMTNR
uniref:p12-13p n=1 Tax=Pyrococcus sp. 12/1 TaxID=758582 RepID=D6MY19_9EURY|nr:p12-13p [Pyrococcus sp. 12/1]